MKFYECLLLHNCAYLNNKADQQSPGYNLVEVQDIRSLCTHIYINLYSLLSFHLILDCLRSRSRWNRKWHSYWWYQTNRCLRYNKSNRYVSAHANLQCHVSCIAQPGQAIPSNFSGNYKCHSSKGITSPPKRSRDFLTTHRKQSWICMIFVWICQIISRECSLWPLSVKISPAWFLQERNNVR